MGFKAQMAVDAVVFLNADEFGETVVYGNDTVDAVVEIGEQPGRGNVLSSPTQGLASKAVVHVSAADVPAPVIGDRIVAAGKTWTVAQIASSDSAMHSLNCTADESPWG